MRGALFFSVIARGNPELPLEDLGKIIVIGNAAQLRDPTDGQRSGRQQLASFVNAAVFNIFGGRGMEIFLEDGIDLAVR